MPSNYKNPTHFVRGYNDYVPRMQGASSISGDGQFEVSLGTPPLAVAAGILSAVAVGATYTTTNFVTNSGFDGPSGKVLLCPYGRELTLVGSGAGTNVVTINGYDYLGQPVRKAIALNGATPVNIGVALLWLTSVAVAAGGAITVNVGFGARLGLPYKVPASGVRSEIADGVGAAAGTLVAPDMTDPATNATTDPRGLYTSTTTLDGVKEISIVALASFYINAAGNGGLHGIQQFGG